MKGENHMNEIQIFNNSDFGEVRVTTINNEPWFIGKDVAEILGYSNTQKAIRDHIDDEDKLTERIVLSGFNSDGSVQIRKTPKVTGKGQMYFINKFLGKDAI